MLTVQFEPFPEMETERLHLRRIVQEDSDALFRLRTDDRVMKYIERPRPNTIADIEKLISQFDEDIQQGNGIVWGISTRENRELVGSIGYYRMQKEHYRAEVGYILSPLFWRGGYMSEAIRQVISYGFKQMGLHSIEAHINPENVASAALLRKTGFIREAYFRENYYWNGTFMDSEVFSLLVGNWENENEVRHQTTVVKDS